MILFSDLIGSANVLSYSICNFFICYNSGKIIKFTHLKSKDEIQYCL